MAEVPQIRGRGATDEIRAFFAHLGQAGHDSACALRAIVARVATVRRARLRPFVLRRASLPFRRKLDVVAEPLRRRRGRADQTHADRADGLHRSALSSAAARRGDCDRRSDAGWPHGTRSRPRHQSGLLPSVRPRLRPAQIANARIRRIYARGVRRHPAVLVSRCRVSYRQRPDFRAARRSARIRRCG